MGKKTKKRSDLGGLVTTYRKSKGLTREELAEALDIGAFTIRKIETESEAPLRCDLIMRISKLIGESPFHIFGLCVADADYKLTEQDFNYLEKEQISNEDIETMILNEAGDLSLALIEGIKILIKRARLTKKDSELLIDLIKTAK